MGLFLAWAAASTVVTGADAVSPYAAWNHGPPTDPAFFPIAVWLQSPANAKRYADAGINTYVGLWKGPTDAHLADLKAAGMKLICEQNEVALRNLTESTIIGWMHGDEPDNAQPSGLGFGHGPPIQPDVIVRGYESIRTKDPTRPVLLNLGQGVAWDQYHGRGVRTNHPEDYPRYVRGGDIVSFDIYPVVHDHPEVAGKLWYVGQGVERLVAWAGDKKVVWNCIECTRIKHKKSKATPSQVRSEVWMSLVHGSMGLIYFVHEWKPVFNEAALLADPEMLNAVRTLNRQVTRLAPVLNQPTLRGSATVESSDPQAPVDVMMKRHEGKIYLFAAGMRGTTTTATFHVPGLAAHQSVEVIDEKRSLTPSGDGRFSDTFEPYAVHLYRMDAK